MLFSSITFLYFFLPITLVLYYVVPKRRKNVVLCLASFFFYAWGEPRYCVLLFLYGLIAYAGGIFLERVDETKRKYILYFCLICFIGGLFYFKYASFVWKNLTNQTLKIVLPIGISFYTFQVISYVIDIYEYKSIAEKNFLTFLTYLSMFPQLIAGPIVRYEEVATDFQNHMLSSDKLAKGIRRFIIGLTKKIILADELGAMVNVIAMIKIENPIIYWVSTIGYTLQIYFDFSGYSDMAIGMGSMLGFSFPENFDYPYVAKSITEFWRRWHMTLSRFLRDYIYIPLGGNRVPYLRWILNMLIVWGISGIWHGAGWNFLLWGLYFGVCLILEKWLTKRGTRQIPVLLQHAYTLFLVNISFVIFGHDHMQDMIKMLKGMFAFGNISCDGSILVFLLKNYGMLLVIAIISATPAYWIILRRLEKNQVMTKIVEALEIIWYIGCFIICTAYLLNHNFHPFLYFRF